jgi:hypothetical protein
MDPKYFYVRVRVQGTKILSGTNVASLSRQIMALLTQANASSQFVLSIFKLGFYLESNNKVHQGVLWIPSFLDLDPKVKPP